MLAAAAFVIAIGYGLVAPALPTFARSFDVGSPRRPPSSARSPCSGCVRAAQRAAGRPHGRAADLPARARHRRVSTGACAFAAEYWQLLVFRSLGGIGSTMFTVASVSMLVRLAPPAMRGRASGLWATGFLLGNLAGPLLGGGAGHVRAARAVRRLRGDAPRRDGADRPAAARPPGVDRRGPATPGRSSPSVTRSATRLPRRPGGGVRQRLGRVRRAGRARAAVRRRGPPAHGVVGRASPCRSSRPATR